MQDLYDRIAHNLFSINMVWALVAGFLVMFMQAGFAWSRPVCAARRTRPTLQHELDDLSAGLPRVLGLRLRHRLGQLVQRSGPAGLVFVARPGLSVLNDGMGIGCGVDAAGQATGAFTYGLIGTKGWFLERYRRR